MHAAEPFPHFVDDYLITCTRLTRPPPLGRRASARRSAGGFRRPGIERLSSALGGFARRLDAIRVDALPETERVERGCSSNVRARRFELEDAGRWERNPQLYADTLATSLAAQVMFDYAPSPSGPGASCRSCVRCRGSSGGARQRQGAAGHLRQGRRRNAARGDDVPRRRSAACVLGGLDDLSLLADLADASTEAGQASPATSSTSRTKCAAGEGLVPPRPAIVRAEAAARRRHLAAGRSPARHRPARAARDAGGIPHARRPPERRRPDRRRGARQAGNAPGPGSSWRRRAAQLGELQTFLQRNDRVAARGERGRSWRRRRSSTAGRLPASGRRGRSRRSAPRAVYYLTDADPSWPLDASASTCGISTSRRSGTSRSTRCSRATILHFQHLRKVESRCAGRRLRAGVVSRRLGALLRADDGRGGLRPARSRAQARAAGRRRSSASRASSSASGCTPTTGRWSRACASSATKRFSRSRAPAAKPSAARSTRLVVYARASWRC